MKEVSWLITIINTQNLTVILKRIYTNLIKLLQNWMKLVRRKNNFVRYYIDCQNIPGF